MIVRIRIESKIYYISKYILDLTSCKVQIATGYKTKTSCFVNNNEEHNIPVERYNTVGHSISCRYIIHAYDIFAYGGID